MTTYIVLLNWNGWRDTVECLDSVLAASVFSDLRVVVCDNGSEDGSIEKIRAWARGDLQISAPERFASLRSPLLHPVPFQELRRVDLEGCANTSATERFIVIRNEANLGFAGGCNVGVRFAMQQPDMEYVWLLNNDTVVQPDALQKMIDELRSRGSRYGMCGSLIKFYDDPGVIQAVGGNRFNHRTGIASQTLGRFLPEESPLNRAYYEAQADYITGASMLVTRAFLDKVGLMDEGYFLYYEEVDWAYRARGRFKWCIATDSVVYHKEGSAIGSSSLNRDASPMSEFYLQRAKLRFARKHLGLWYVLSYLATCAQLLNRLRQQRWANAAVLGRVLLGYGYRRSVLSVTQ